MITSNQKTSLLVPSQLPEFVRDDMTYENFVLFLQAYYEWLEQQDNVTDLSKNLLSYKDIDNLEAANTAAQGTDYVVDNFINYFYNDFLSYFPQDILADKTKVLKLAKQLYQSKGTPSSYKFLFRVLYNTEVEFFNTEDVVLKASSGKWYVAKSLKLATENINFLSTTNLRIFGESSKSIATIENSIFDGLKTEVFISNIERLFQSGEFVRVVDANNQDVYFLNGQIVPIGTPGSETLSAKIVGQISQIKINPNYRGQQYQPGDPVVVSGGLTSNTGHGATATVGQTTTGSIQRINVLNGGFGYSQYPNTQISISNAPGAIAHVGQVDTTPSNVANVTFTSTDYIGQKASLTLGATNYFFPGRFYANVSSKPVYTLNEYAYQGISLSSNTFSGKVISFDSTNNIVYLQNTTGTPSATFLINGNSSGTFRTLNSYSVQGPNTVIFVTNGEYIVGEIVYQGSINNPTFYGTISTDDTVNNKLKLVQLNSVNVACTGIALTGVSTGVVRTLLSIDNSSNANSTLADALSFTAFSTYPIASILVDNGGGGINQTPVVSAQSLFESQDNQETIDLATLGICAPIQIVSGGQNYSINDKIVIAGGSGVGAYANITSVSAGGSITGVSYVYPVGQNPPLHPLGGEGYFNFVPNVKVTTSTGSNAVLQITGTLGTGATFNPVTTRVGTVTTINIIDPGEDYIAAPNVSFKVQDIVVTGITVNNPPRQGDAIYQTSGSISLTANVSQSAPSNNIVITNTNNIFSQIANSDFITGTNIPASTYIAGTDVSNNIIILSASTTSNVLSGNVLSVTVPSYKATVDSIELLIPYQNPTQSLYNLRVFNYNSKPNYNLPLKIDSKSLTLTLSNLYNAFNVHSRYDSTGVITYGDGTAQGTASFLNGLVLSSGQYLDSTGQPSGFDVLQSTNYNSFTYQITLEKEIEKYRTVLMNLLHPSGMKVLGRYAMKSNSAFETNLVDALDSSHSLGYYTSQEGTAQMVANFTNQSNNIVTFNNLAGADIETIIFPNSYIEMVSSNGDIIYSKVTSVFNGTNEDLMSESGLEDMLNEISASEDLLTEGVGAFITLQDNTWLAFANVAQVTANAGSSFINIRSLTGSYNIINNGNYTNANVPLMDIVRAGDSILVANNSVRTVTNVNYLAGVVYLNTPLTSNVNSLMSVNRTFTATNQNIRLIGAVGLQYLPQLLTEDGRTLTDEQGNILVIG